MSRLVLVRHGRPAVRPATPAHEWPLAEDAAQEVLALAPVGQPGDRWHSSPEPKALATAQLLAGGPTAVEPDLREAGRTAVRLDDPGAFQSVVLRGFAAPDEPTLDGWEPLTSCRDRVVAVVRRLLRTGRDTVLVGHGTAWTLLVAELTGEPPDLRTWTTMPMPAVTELEVSADGHGVVRSTWRG